MSEAKSQVTAMTVLGPVQGNDLGITLTHEHLLFDGRKMFIEPAEPELKLKAYDPIRMENLGQINFNPLGSLDNLGMLEEDTAIIDAQRFRVFGGGTIVDCTPVNIGRDPDALSRISKAAGINVIMGAGYYKPAAWNPELAEKSVEEIADEFTRDILVGVGKNRVRTGIIGELVCSAPLEDIEIKVLKAAALAQQQTGAPISVHPGYSETSALEIIDLLNKTGADISQTIMCHIDASVRKRQSRKKLAETGCYLEYDHVGRLDYYYFHPWTLDYPDDMRRIDEIIDLIDQGYGKQLLISLDLCVKHQRIRYGGYGFEHILRNFIPLMRRKGISEEHINDILVENPKSVLCFLS